MSQEWVLNGRLLALTSTGPLYRGNGEIAVIPVSSALALLQELALRTLGRGKNVSSSLAARIRGEDAYDLWAHVSGCFAANVTTLSPSARLRVLAKLVRYIRNQENANGLEAVLCTTINATWPWLRLAALQQVLEHGVDRIRASDFARKARIPVVDPATRTITIFEPDQLGDLDPRRWMDDRAFQSGNAADVLAPYVPGWGLGSGISNVPGWGGPLDGSGGPDLSAWGGPDLSSSGTPISGIGGFGSAGDGWNAGGGLWQGSGPWGGTGNPWSGQGSGPSPSGLGQTGNGGLGAGWGWPSGLAGPDLTAWGGPDLSSGFPKAPGGKRGASGLGGLGGFGGFDGPGSSLDLSNIAGNGGPFGFGSSLGVGGAATPNDAEKTAGAKQGVKGQIEIAAGLAIGLWGLGQVVGSGGTPAIAIGGAAVIVGYLLVLDGINNFSQGAKKETEADLKKPGPVEQPKPEGEKKDPPKTEEQKKEEKKESDKKPKGKDLYPDPDGGGTGDPTKLPAYEGGGGNPKTLWDGEGGVGPNTIWEDQGGRPPKKPTAIWDNDGNGGGPTTRGEIVEVTMTDGPGLLASIAMVAPNVYKY